MRSRRKITMRCTLGVLLAAIVGLVAAGCGGGSGSGGSGGDASSANVKTAAAQFNQYTGLPKFKAPGPQIDAKSIMRGKSILAIPVTSANPFTTGLEAEQAQLAKRIGFRYIRWNNNGTVAEWTKGIQYGIAQKVSLIALDGGSQPKLLGPAIQRARAAGIIVVDTHETANEQGKSPSVNFTIPAPYSLAGKLMVLYAVQQTKGNVDALIITSSDVIGTPPFAKSIESTFAKYCPSCKTTSSDVTVANWASDIGPAVTGALEKDPNINFILPLYDPEVEYIIPALRQAHKTSDVSIDTYAGTGFALKDLGQGEVAMDVGEADVGYPMLDDEMRLIGKLKPVFPEYLAIRAFTKDNIGSGSSFANYGSTATQDSWLRLWKMGQ